MLATSATAQNSHAMDSVEYSKIAGIFFLSTVKLLFAPGAAIASGLSLPAAMLTTSCGGCSGVVFFYYFGHWFSENFSAMLKSRSGGKQHKNGASRTATVFNRRNRFLIKIKSRTGMIGLAILTPAIISVPVGSVLAARYFYDSKWMLPLLLFSTIIWCILLTYLSISIKQDLLQW